MLPEIFTHIEGYQFQELLGQGGFGAVCKAIDKLGREVAIKVLTLREETGQREASNKAFLKEATTLAKLHHPNVVTIYSFDIDSSGLPYLVMEFLPGESLSKIIRSGRPLHLVEKLSIVLQAAKALQAAHQVKPEPVVHRDIKPANLMVMPDLTVKLIDFGIAQVGGAMSRSMNIAGSLAYMSPEHWQTTLTPWGDVFSLGVVLYELLTGRVPYATEQDSVPAAYQKLISSTPAPPLKQFLTDVPAGLEEIVAKVLSKEKARGYENAQSFWLDLSRVYNAVKPQFLAEGIERAITAKNAGDYATASELVAKMLSIDRDNHEIGALQSEINQTFQRRERSVKVRAICERVEEALVSKKFDLAQLGLDEARQLDPESQTVALLGQRIRLARELYAKIEVLVADAKKQQQSGRWKAARELVDDALVLDRTNTLVLNLRAQIERMMAHEHQLCEDARVALDQQRFQEAFEIIRRAEALAPQSERVRTLKEYAVTIRQNQIDREEIEAAFQNGERLYAAGDLAAARHGLQLALTKYPGQKRLLGLRDAVELRMAALQREKFVQEECAIAEQASIGGDLGSALVRLEEALLKYPDEAKLLKAADKAKRLLAMQTATKRKTQYAEQARESLRAGRAREAVVTLEMALSECANDRELSELLAQASAAVAMQAADYDSAIKILKSAQINFPSSQQIADALRSAQEQAARSAGARTAENAGQNQIAAPAGTPVKFDPGVLETPSKLPAPATEHSSSRDVSATLMITGGIKSLSGACVPDSPALPRVEATREALDSAKPVSRSPLSEKPVTTPAKVKRSAWSARQRMIAAAPLLLLALLVAYKLIKMRHRAPIMPPTELRANVPGSTFLLDGHPVNSPVVLSPGQEHVLEASHEGYQSNTQKTTVVAGRSPSPPIEFVLTPLFPHLRVLSDIQKAAVSVGEQPAAVLQDGSLDLDQIPAGTQVIKFFRGSRLIFELPLNVEPGRAVTLAGPVESANYSIAVASVLGTHAKIFASADLNGNSNGQTPQAIPAEGLDVDTKSSGPIFNLSNDRTLSLEPSNQPELIISLTATTRHLVKPDGAVATLILKSAEPNSELFIDDALRAALPDTGTVLVTSAPGRHKIVLKKTHYEDSPAQTWDLKAGEKRVLEGSSFVLIQQGALAFHLSPSSAKATYHLENQPQTSAAHDGETVWVKPGMYLIQIEAPGYEASSVTLTVNSGATQPVIRKLNPVVVASTPAPPPQAQTDLIMEDATQWSKKDGWWVLNKKDHYGWLRPTQGTFEVTIQRKTGFLGHSKKVEWTIDYREADRIVYSIDGNKFHRLTYKDGKPTPEETKEMSNHSGNYGLTFEVSTDRVVIRERGGAILDEYDRPNPSVGLGKIGFRGDITVLVKQK